MKQPTTHNPTVVISIDLELAWGNGGKHAFLPLHVRERSVIDQYLQLSERYRMRSTWATVGNLFLRDLTEAKERGVALYGRAPRVYDTLIDQQGVDESLWFGADIIERILSCVVPQEVGCHSFFHTLVHEVDAETYAKELLQARHLAKDKYGINMVSYVHPRNIIGHLSVLRSVGFENYRGQPEVGAYLGLGEGPLRRVLETLMCVPVKAQYVTNDVSGLVNVPASYFLAMTPIKQLRPPFPLLMRRIMRSIDAVREGGIFHLWFHPHNIARDPQFWLRAIEETFIYIDRARSEGRLAVATMGELSRRISDTI